MVLNRPTANFNNFTARGIATNGYGANLQSTVAIYLDELPISSNGNSTILDPSLFDEDRDMIEDLVAAAFNDAANKLASETQARMANVAGGMNLPPGFSLPF